MHRVDNALTALQCKEHVTTQHLDAHIILVAKYGTQRPWDLKYPLLASAKKVYADPQVSWYDKPIPVSPWYLGENDKICSGSGAVKLFDGLSYHVNYYGIRIGGFWKNQAQARAEEREEMKAFLENPQAHRMFYL